MYLPKSADISGHPQSRELTLDVMRRHPFVTLVSQGSEGPLINHVPVLVREEGEKLVIVGHLSRNNEHLKRIKAGESVTVVFHGPHAYISPMYYVVKDVPTWNYAVVHARGRGKLVEGYDEIVALVRELSEVMEAGRANPWEFNLPPDLSGENVLPKAIAGFEIYVEHLEAKFKLGQRLGEEDRASLRSSLASNPDDGSQGLLHYMATLMPPAGKPSM